LVWRESRSVPVSEIDALLFANEAFYRAFADRDVKAMEAAWSEREPIVCIHPGWDVLTGREAVLQSWAAIIANPNSPDIKCHDAVAFVQGDVGVVVCYEELEGQFLIATNLFVHEGRIWKIMHHQSGPTAGQPATEEGEEDPERIN
jgi:ketosteroid isomerase-like protein